MKVARKITASQHVPTDEFSGRESFYDFAKTANITKKFYSDFTERELDALEDMRDLIAESYVQIPPFVVARMVDRGMIEDVGLFDENGNLVREKIPLLNSQEKYAAIPGVLKSGMFFEFSDEGVQNNYSHYRLVLASQLEGYTLFVKVAVPPKNNTVRVLDVWQKVGKVPYYPLPKQRAMFNRGKNWDIEDTVDDLLDKAEESNDFSEVELV